MSLDSLIQDVRIGLRTLIKEKGFCTLTALLVPARRAMRADPMAALRVE